MKGQQQQKKGEESPTGLRSTTDMRPGSESRNNYKEEAIIAGGCGVLSKIGGVKEYHGVHTTPIQEEGKNMPLTVTASVNSASAQLSMIPMLNGTNYVTWKENVEIVLGCMDLDLALRKEQPVPTTDDPKTDQIEKWEGSNCMCLAIMKSTIPTGFRGSIAESTSAKKFLSEIEQYFAKNEKVETSNLLSKLVTMKYKGKGNIREYIIGMSNLAGKLKELKLELSDELLVHLVLISLPPLFRHFVVSYNTQKEKWTLNELISHCMQGEERVLREKTESAHLASSSHDKKRKRGKDIASGKPKNQLYGYLYLIHENSQALDVFKEYKAEVELQLNSSIKVVRSDHGGAYYGRYDGSGKPNMNGVDERRNRTLKDMLRQGHIGRIKRNWTLGRSVAILLGIRNVLADLKYYDPAIRSFFETDNARFFEDVDFGREDIGKSIVFEEDSHDPIYDSTESNDQIMIPIIVQGPPVQDNTEIPHEEPIEQTQQPHESQEVPLRGSTRERKSAIPDDYVVFL
ncbi:hypothetical protein AgCh_004952 [Apium graveolens]